MTQLDNTDVKKSDRRAMIVAGESSGDLHGSNLLRAAAALDPQLSFYGVGGGRMREAGCEILIPSEELSVMGLVEVFGQLPKIVRRFRQLKRQLEGGNPPDLLLLIDFPDFNLRLARVAKRAGIPVLYYISPKVWAWRRGRIKTIAERVDRLALIFPFEPELFAGRGLEAVYVGNPLLDEYQQHRPAGDLRERLQIEPNRRVVGIFPGSRNSELKYIFDTLLETADELLKQQPELHFLLPVAPSLQRSWFEERLAERELPLSLVEENIYEVAAACDAVLCVSGTVTLQTALVGTPLAILYRVAPLSYAIGKRLVDVSHVGLANIVAGKTVAREFIQEQAEPSLLAGEILRLLNDRQYAETMRQELERVQRLMGEPGCSARVARMASEMSCGMVHSASYGKDQGATE